MLSGIRMDSIETFLDISNFATKQVFQQLHIDLRIHGGW